MSILDAVVVILESEGEPLHYRDITRLALERGLWQTDGATPDATVNARLAMDIQSRGAASRFQRTGRGLFALRAWGLPEHVTPKAAGESGVATIETAPPPSIQPMTMPGFQEFFRPFLEMAADGHVHSLAEAREAIAARFALPDELRAELLPSGRQRRFDNRIAWTKVHLDAADLIEPTGRGHFVITDRGRELLATDERIDLATLGRYEEYRQFRSRTKSDTTDSSDSGDAGQTETPEEIIERGYQSLRSELAVALLQRVRESSPGFFEQLVVDLLLKMGYGRSRTDAGQAIGNSGDEGIDGIISEDRLGLDTIYIQAKRWQGTVGRPEIQKFVGALHGQRARKGVFLTTGTFSREATEYVRTIDPRVVLIDGAQLAEYMIDYGLGVTTRSTFEIKRVDSDYFTEA